MAAIIIILICDSVFESTGKKPKNPINHKKWKSVRMNVQGTKVEESKKGDLSKGYAGASLGTWERKRREGSEFYQAFITGDQIS